MGFESRVEGKGINTGHVCDKREKVMHTQRSSPVPDR